MALSSIADEVALDPAARVRVEAFLMAVNDVKRPVAARRAVQERWLAGELAGKGLVMKVEVRGKRQRRWELTYAGRVMMEAENAKRKTRNAKRETGVGDGA